MIDEKTIEEAAIEYIDDEGRGFESFIAGAEWAINKFLKDLWHDASEKPTRGKFLLTQSVSGIGTNKYEYEVETATHVLDYCRENPLYRWLYIDDLFPKKGK